MRVRFSKEFSCAEQDVQVEDLGGSAYRASGCGQTATYVCNTGRYQNEAGLACAKEGTQLPK